MYVMYNTVYTSKISSNFIFSYIKNRDRQRQKTERIKNEYNKPELTIHPAYSDDLYSLLAYGHRVAWHTETRNPDGGEH